MAKDTIGSMTAVVRATAGSFSADIKSIAADIQSLKGKVEASTPKGGLFESMKQGFGIGAGMGVFDAMKNAVGSLFEVFSKSDNLADFASMVGSTAEEVSGLRYAAGQAGASANDFDGAIQKMTQKLGEARGGAEGTQEAFSKLGLNVDELSQMSGGEAFKAIAEGFKGIQNPADRAALAVDIFGKQGIKLVNMLGAGKAGLEAFIEQGKELGAVLSNEDVAAAGAASDAIEALTAAWDGLKLQLTIFVLPAINAIIDALKTMIGWVNKAIKAIREFFFGVDKAAEAQAKAAVELERQQKTAEEALRAQQKAAQDMAKAYEDLQKRGMQLYTSLRTPQEVFADETADLVNLVHQGAIGWETYRRAAEKAVSELEKAVEVKEELSRFEQTPAIGGSLRGTTAGFSAVQSAIRLQSDIGRRQIEINQRQLAAEERAAQHLRSIEDLMRRGHASGGVDL